MMGNQKICMLLHEYYPNDIRVSKEVAPLIEAGFDIHLICLQRKGESAQGEVNGIHVHRIDIAQSFFWRGIWDILLVVFGFYQPVFYRKLKALMKQYGFDAIHVHDLPLSHTALRLKKKYPELKVILDFHENYPEALKVWFQWKSNPLIRLKNRLFFNFSRWLKYEKKASQKADHIIVVVEEMKDRIINTHRLNPDKITVITNSESTDFLNQTLYPDVYEKNKGDFILAYTGNVGPHRGVDTIIKALANLKDKPAIRLEITGNLSKDTENWLNQLIDENGVGSQVKLNGYQPFHKFFSYMALADVNLIPHNRNGHTDNTIPHKLFQGMLVGKPVLVSNAPPLERVVNSLQSGLVFEAGNPHDCAEKINALYSDSGLYKTLGANGLEQTTKNNVNWEAEGLRLVSLYQELLA
ncbi:glycosyltransferase family 4 protein [Roseivirga sp.]|uniref:glycosyltransferase family 4 protein n=1 Tax=Roseivirga sp. TaxID=1964215 RepID=UPI003B52B282